MRTGDKIAAVAALKKRIEKKKSHIYFTKLGFKNICIDSHFFNQRWKKINVKTWLNSFYLFYTYEILITGVWYANSTSASHTKVQTVWIDRKPSASLNQKNAIHFPPDFIKTKSKNIKTNVFLEKGSLTNGHSACSSSHLSLLLSGQNCSSYGSLHFLRFYTLFVFHTVVLNMDFWYN